MGKARRAVDFVLPSVTGAIAGAVIAGGFEALPNTYTFGQALAAIGFVTIVAAPAGALASALVRLLWRGWRFSPLESYQDERGAAYELAAWLIYLLLSVAVLTSAAFQSVRLLFGATASRVTIVLGATIAATVASVVLVSLSLPAVRGLRAAFERIDRRLRPDGKSLFSARRVLAALAVVTIAACVVAWLLWVAPRLSTQDLTPALYGLLFLAALVAVPLLWRKLGRAQLVAGGGAIVVAAVAVTGALWLRASRPYSMLEVWGETRIAGAAIDVVYDVEKLRGEVRVEGVRPEARPGATPRDVVLITIDTLRADRLPMHGGKARMPALKGFAKQAVVFDWAFSPGNVTRRSLPTIATGISPRRLRGRIAGWALRLDPRHVMLAERFKAAGYDTAGFFCCGSQFSPEHSLGLNRGIDHLVIEESGAELSKLAGTWIQERGTSKRPLFVWIHIYDPHRWEFDYPRSKHGANAKYRYDLALTEVDRSIRRILEAARSDELEPRTYVALTSDHGEGLGDHDVKNHATTLYNSEIRVPLLVAGPELEPKRISEPVGLVDLAPTLLDLAGFVPPEMPAMDGISFADILRGKTRAEAGEAYAVMIPDHSVKETWWAIVSGHYKLIDRGGAEELYDLHTDPHERHDVADARPKVLEEMENRLRRRKLLDRVPPF